MRATAEENYPPPPSFQSITHSSLFYSISRDIIVISQTIPEKKNHQELKTESEFARIHLPPPNHSQTNPLLPFFFDLLFQNFHQRTPLPPPSSDEKKRKNIIEGVGGGEGGKRTGWVLICGFVGKKEKGVLMNMV